MVYTYEQLLAAARSSEAAYAVVPFEGRAIALPVNIQGPMSESPRSSASAAIALVACVAAHTHLRGVREL